MDPRDNYGNPVRRTDEYGNPVSHTGQGTGTMGSYGTQEAAPTAAGLGLGGFDHTGTGTGVGAIGGAPGQHHHQPQEHRGVTGMLHRSGSSSSSSSSEDDGVGGRRKKGLKEKIKDKLPCGGSGKCKEKHTHTHTAAHTTGVDEGGYYGGAQQQHPVVHDTAHEKKGMMDKIKDMLPGTHNTNH